MIKDISKKFKQELRKNYVDRYIEEFNNDNWAGYRDKGSKRKRFQIQEKLIQFIGNKKVYIPIESEYNINLQESRGIGITKDTTIDKIIDESIESINELIESDVVRSDELDEIIRELSTSHARKNFLEIGFRIPKIQSYYKNTFGMEAYGIDINVFNVDLFSELGFNCFSLDLMKNESISEKLNKKFDVVVCYHVLEHIANPDEAVKNIFDSMNSGGIFHVEIPIEPGQPRLEYGHLISYDPHDMSKLLSGVGFKIVHATNKTHSDGPWIERYIALKE